MINAAEATRKPTALAYSLLADGVAFRDADPARALDAFRRGLMPSGVGSWALRIA